MPSTHAFFIAGTDTGVGKTFVTTLLLRAARSGGYRTLGMKPVVAGVDAHGRNDDVGGAYGRQQLQRFPKRCQSVSVPCCGIAPHRRAG